MTVKEYQKQYKETHKEQIKEQKKEYREKNKEKLYSKKKEYLETEKGKEVRKKAVDKYNKSDKRKNGSLKKYNNSDKRRAYAREWVKNKRKNNLNYRLKTCVSASLRNYFTKTDITIKIIGYKISDLKNHLEKLFNKEMSWNNYGKFWNIDHIIPQSLYDFKDEIEIKKCWSLKNLRPLKVEENLSKRNSLNEKLIEEYNLRDFLPAKKME